MSLLQTRLVRWSLSLPWLVAFLKLVVPPLDRFLLRATRGWISTAMQPVVLMETTGARSGLARRTATLCFPREGTLVLAGSNWGKPRHPAWVHNLRRNPDVRVWFRGYCGPMRAREVSGEERAELWLELERFNPQYGRYQAGIEREIPLFTLAKVEGP